MQSTDPKTELIEENTTSHLTLETKAVSSLSPDSPAVDAVDMYVLCILVCVCVYVYTFLKLFSSMI